MIKTRTIHASALLVLATGMMACSAAAPQGGDGDGDDGSGPGPGGGDGDGGVELPPGVVSADLLPARIRRLTNSEYDAAVASLLGTTRTFGASFPPDTRQHGYTVNEAQRIDPVLARALDTAAMALAEEARPSFSTLAPCSDVSTGATGCASTFIDAFAGEAYRRPLSEEDKQPLLALFAAGTVGEAVDAAATPESTYADGIALLIRGVLQSPAFLYVTETGGVDPVGSIQMTGHEIASALSFLLTGGPPDAELLGLAESGALLDSASRDAQARRLLASEPGQARAVMFVSQWLGIDRINVTAKDASVYPEFEALRTDMAQETADFVRGALAYDGGSLSSLMTAESAVARPTLAGVYAAGGPPRNGLLNQAAFLSVYAHAHETAPVLRGTAVMRRVACVDIELPTTLDLVIVPPVPDPTQTTRARFTVHTQDDACAGCHKLIDPIGFVFEQFDGMGAHQTTEFDKAIDSTGDVSLGLDFDGMYASSTEFASALATSSDVAACFARQIYRAHAAEGEGIEQSEQAFAEERALAEGGASLIETLVAYTASESFIFRRNP